jgi:hypothetical protein
MARYRLTPLSGILILLILGGCASGSSIVTGTVRAPITPEQVTIYVEPPAEFEVVGLVNASSDAGWTEQGSVDYAVQELKAQAARLGANGVLLVSTGERTTTTYIASGSVLLPVPVTAKTVQGRAIFVKKR